MYLPVEAQPPAGVRSPADRTADGRPATAGRPATDDPGRSRGGRSREEGTPSRRSRSRSAGRGPGARFRRDIEGMRALAVLLVVAFHAGLGPVQGGFVGVDVFFVISGFLITGLLVDEVGRTGSIDLPAFWARRMRRLLPMATAVLVTTVVVFRFVLAPLDREGLGDSVVASALWTANWHFAADETDYMSDAAHSPVLHYWSLSVEEQFYLVWPLLILFVLWLSRRLGDPGASGVPEPDGSRAAGSLAAGSRTAGSRTAGSRTAGSRAWTVLCRGEGRVPVRWFAAALVVLGGVSLLASLLLTRSSGPWAYYGLHTRAWELAAGAGLALARPLADLLPRAWAVVSGWGGLALICLSALLIDRSTAFPGGAAIWPVLGACLLLAAGARSRSGASYLLSRPLPMFLGRISYGWYLWHWPCLQLAHHLAAPVPQEDELVARGGPGLWPVLLAVVGSLLLAVLTHQVIELPVRRWTWLVAFPRRALVAGACLLLVATSVPSLLLVSTTSPSTAAVGRTDTDTDADTGTDAGTSTGDRTGTERSTGHSAGDGTGDGRAGGTSSGTVVLRASPEQARNDQQTPNRCFVSFNSPTADPRCRFGDPTARRTMVLFGDSHAAHWFPALEEIARREKWQLLVWAKSGCGYAETAQWLSNFRREYTECTTWREAVLQQIDALPRVDAVVVARSMHQLGKLMDEDGRLTTDEEARRRLWAEGADRTLRRLRARAGAVVLVRDSPRPPRDIPACLSEHPSDPGRCDFPFAGNADRDGQVFRAELEAIRTNGIQVMGTSDLVCDGDRCPAVSRHGNITYRDNHHLTGSFARELSTVFGRRLLPLIERRS